MIVRINFWNLTSDYEIRDLAGESTTGIDGGQRRSGGEWRWLWSCGSGLRVERERERERERCLSFPQQTRGRDVLGENGKCWGEIWGLIFGAKFFVLVIYKIAIVFLIYGFYLQQCHHILFLWKLFTISNGILIYLTEIYRYKFVTVNFR